MARLPQVGVSLLATAAVAAGEHPRLRGLTVVAPPEVAPTATALPVPTLEPADSTWWQAPQPEPSETDCLMDHRFGCDVIKHRETCLGSKDGRPNRTLHDLKVHGQPCVWCGGLACRDGKHTLCEPLDFLMRGEGKAFGTFFAKHTYQVAKCVDGEPSEYRPVYRRPPPLTAAPWWVPSRPENLTCLKSYTPGCHEIQDMGSCLTSTDGRSTERLGGFRVRGEPCVWCGGGACHSNSSNLCEPFDWLMRGEGTNFGVLYAKTDFQVAGCSHDRSFHLPRVDLSCLTEDAQGCHSNTDAISCLSSRDGRDSRHIAGLKVKGQPCVWCGGGACHSNNGNTCEPFDLALSGQGKAFDHFHAKLTWRMAACKNDKPAAVTLDAFEDSMAGYVPPAASLAAGPSELVPFRVPRKPSRDNTQCLRRHAAGCSDITDMATCMTSRDGSASPPIAGLKVAGEPCVWCGGAPCTTNSTSLCGPFDLLMYGEGKVFSSFSGKGVYRVADCTKGSVERPDYDYSCLSKTDPTKGCPGIGDAETCLARLDGRSGSVGPLAVGGEPCVWCGGGPCHTASSARCEAFDFALNGESVAFATFHALGSFRLAACRGGKPTAATLTNFTDFVPGYTSKPPPPPKVPVFNASWWKSEPPAASELSCLMDHKFGCNVVRHRETCLGSKDGRAQSSFGGGVKVHGQPCVWCGGGTCTTGSAAVCEPFDLVMNGEGLNFTTFYAKNSYQVARCKDGKPLPPVVAPAASPRLMVPLSSQSGQATATIPATPDPGSTSSQAVATDGMVGGSLPNLPALPATFPPLPALPALELPAGSTASTSSTAPPVPSGTSRTDGAPAYGTVADARFLARGHSPGGAVHRKKILQVTTAAPGADCWDACGNSGLCDFCGAGQACCRLDYDNPPPACAGATGFTSGQHQCVPIAVNSTQAPGTPAPEPLPETTSAYHIAMLTLPPAATLPLVATLPPIAALPPAVVPPQDAALPAGTTTATSTPNTNTTVVSSTAGPGSAALGEGALARGQPNSIGLTTDDNWLVEGFHKHKYLIALLSGGIFLALCLLYVFYGEMCCATPRERQKKNTRSAKKDEHRQAEQDTDSETAPSSATTPELEMRQPLVQGDPPNGVLEQAANCPPQAQLQMVLARPSAPAAAGYQPLGGMQSAAVPSGSTRSVGFAPVPTGSVQSVGSAAAPSGSMILQAGGALVPAGTGQAVPVQSVGAASVPAGSFRLQPGGTLVPAGTGYAVR